MTVLMVDAVDRLLPEDRALLQRGCLAELLYADDTLLLSVSPASLQRFLRAVSEAGATYGLELHWGKLQLLQVRCDDEVQRPDSSSIDPQEDLVYLGTVISSDGRLSKELARRLGMAYGAFRDLSCLWRHSTLGRRRKIELFNSLVVSKLLYGLAACWLNVSERRRIDGFQNRCLRAIWGIKPAYVSRVSNASVLQTVGEKPLSRQLERQQLQLFGRVARQDDEGLMRQATFCPGSLQPATERYVRKQGRPRLEWTSAVYKLALQAAGGMQQLQDHIGNERSWRNVVDTFSKR
jgi:hypothetical protein